MKTFSFAAFIILATIVVAACTSSSDLTKEKWTITVSTGGGFTGMSSGYTMIETGEVFAWNGQEGDHEKTNKIGSISAEKAHDFKIKLAAGLDSMQLNAPGNMSTSIELDANGHAEKITWGAADHPNAPDQLSGWYNDFMQTCGAMQKQ